MTTTEKVSTLVFWTCIAAVYLAEAALLVVFATNYLQPSSIFFLSGALIVLSGLLVPLIPQKRAQER